MNPERDFKKKTNCQTNGLLSNELRISAFFESRQARPKGEVELLQHTQQLRRSLDVGCGVLLVTSRFFCLHVVRSRLGM